MATIPTKKVDVKGSNGGNGPPQKNLYIAASQTCVRGDLGTLLAAGLNYTTTPNATQSKTNVGFAPLDIVSAPAVGTASPVTLLLPGYFYELTLTGTGGVPGTSYETVDNAIGVVISQAATTDPTFTVVYYPGEVDGYFETNRFIAKTATSETAGAVNQPYAATHGVRGDTAARVVCVGVAANCILF